MDFSDTNLDFLQDDLVQLYGPEQGELLYAAACNKYQQLVESKEMYPNQAMNEHIFKRIFPAMALYFSLMDQGVSKEDALQSTLKETQHNARRMKAKNAKLAKLPFSYTLFRMFAKSHIAKNFPSDGWDVAWKRADGQEVHFDMTHCIYQDMCKEYGCPELCTVFCQNDITAFAGYLPKIKFERAGTLGEGSDKCDFHFIRVK